MMENKEKQGQSSTPADILGIKLLTAFVSLVFIAMISIDCKITNFCLTCLITFGNNYNIIGELTSAISKKKKEE